MSGLGSTLKLFLRDDPVTSSVKTDDWALVVLFIELVNEPRNEKFTIRERGRRRSVERRSEPWGWAAISMSSWELRRSKSLAALLLAVSPLVDGEAMVSMVSVLAVSLLPLLRWASCVCSLCNII
jgi:hypothetical protein